MSMPEDYYAHFRQPAQIISILQNIETEISAQNRMGDMRPLVLREAIKIISAATATRDRYVVTTKSPASNLVPSARAYLLGIEKVSQLVTKEGNPDVVNIELSLDEVAYLCGKIGYIIEPVILHTLAESMFAAVDRLPEVSEAEAKMKPKQADPNTSPFRPDYEALEEASKKPMPELQHIKNWLLWVIADGYRTDGERMDAKTILKMIEVSPRTAVPNLSHE